MAEFIKLNTLTKLSNRLDGVVVVVEQTLHSPLLEPTSVKQIRSIDLHLGVAATGLLPDARQLTRRARGEAHDYRSTYGSPAPVHVVAERLAAITHNYTLHSYMRPWGAAALVAGIDEDGPALWLVETSGVVNGYYATAIGKGARQCKSELEKLKLTEMTCAELVRELTRIVYFAHDDAKEQDKPFTVEIGWCCDASKRKFVNVPAELRQAAIDAAQAAINARDLGSDDEADLDA